MLAYISGLTWFLVLLNEGNMPQTFISEKAFLTEGMMLEFSEHAYTNAVLKNLHEACSSNRLKPALEQEFTNLGLEVFSQHIPPNNSYNLYGIVRAYRSVGVESLVINTPFSERDCAGLPGLALALGLARYTRSNIGLSKDIILLASQKGTHGLGVWLGAYHGVQDSSPLPLHGRSGTIVAALSVIVQSNILSHVDLRIEGQNGQLPNRDTVKVLAVSAENSNLVAKMHTQPLSSLSTHSNYLSSLRSMLLHMLSQSSFVASGNHGEFLKYNIEALTVQAVSSPSYKKDSFTHLGRMVEGYIRSFNNLLEKVHAGSFFYLMPSPSHFIPQGQYVGCFFLLTSGLMLCGIVYWFVSDTGSTQKKVSDQPCVLSYIAFFMTAMGQSLLLKFMIPNIGSRLSQAVGAHCLLLLSSAVSIRYFSMSSARLWMSLCCLSHAVTWAVIGMINFSTGFVSAVLLLPWFLTAAFFCSRCTRPLRILLAVLTCPLTWVLQLCAVRLYLVWASVHEPSYVRPKLWNVELDAFFGLTPNRNSALLPQLVWGLLIPNWMVFAALMVGLDTV